MLRLSEENLRALIAKLSRRQLIELLGHLQCGFDLDFTPEFLGSLSLQQLRHLVTAVAENACDAKTVNESQEVAAPHG